MSDANGPTRRHLLQAGAAIGGATLASRTVWAQAKAPPTKVLDFHTYADMAKVEQEGQFVFYCHENEAGTAAIVDAFTKDFPKDPGQLRARADRCAVQQGPGRAQRRPLRRGRDPAFRPCPRDRFPEEGRLRNLPIARGARLPGEIPQRSAGRLFLDRRGLHRHLLQQGARAEGGRAEDLEGSARPALEGRDELQDRRLRPAVRAVVRTAQTVRRRLLEELRQAASARLRQPRATDGPAGARRRQGDRGGRIRGLCAVSEEGRRRSTSSRLRTGCRRRRWWSAR